MARNEVLDALTVQGENITARAQGEDPVEDIERRFVENIHAANRLAKKMLKRKVTDKLRRGVEGETYDKTYAARKRRETGRLYGTSGPVDFRYSGALWNELVGRGRAKPSEPSLTFWLGLKHPNRRHPESGPSGYTYRQVVSKLRKEKPGPDGNPFGPTARGREQIAEKVADRLMNVGS